MLRTAQDRIEVPNVTWAIRIQTVTVDSDNDFEQPFPSQVEFTLHSVLWPKHDEECVVCEKGKDRAALEIETRGARTPAWAAGARSRMEGSMWLCNQLLVGDEKLGCGGQKQHHCSSESYSTTGNSGANTFAWSIHAKIWVRRPVRKEIHVYCEGPNSWQFLGPVPRRKTANAEDKHPSRDEEHTRNIPLYCTIVFFPVKRVSYLTFCNFSCKWYSNREILSRWLIVDPFLIMLKSLRIRFKMCTKTNVVWHVGLWGFAVYHNATTSFVRFVQNLSCQHWRWKFQI